MKRRFKESCSQEDHIIDIKTGSGTPDAKAARAQMAMGLYQNNAIDRIALLDANEYPDRQAINPEWRNNSKIEWQPRPLVKKWDSKLKKP